MAKKRSLEQDEAALRKKLADKLASVTGNREADPALRALRRRLKRAQRKRRVLQQRVATKKSPQAEGAATP